MSLRRTIQGMSEDMAISRRKFERATIFNRQRERDALLVSLSYGVQNCLRALAMLHSDGPVPGLVNAVSKYRENLASVDTHPKDGDALAAPFTSGAVGEAETPNPSHRSTGE